MLNVEKNASAGASSARGSRGMLPQEIFEN